MRNRSRFEYYKKVYIFVILIVLMFDSIRIVAGLYENYWFLLNVIWLPILFILLNYLIDIVLVKVKKTAVKNSDTLPITKDEEGFYKFVGQEIQKKTDLQIEDYRRIRKSPKFQTNLARAYAIYADGESELYNTNKLSKLFKVKSREYIAMSVIVEILKEHIKSKEQLK